MSPERSSRASEMVRLAGPGPGLGRVCVEFEAADGLEADACFLGELSLGEPGHEAVVAQGGEFDGGHHRSRRVMPRRLSHAVGSVWRSTRRPAMLTPRSAVASLTVGSSISGGEPMVPSGRTSWRVRELMSSRLPGSRRGRSALARTVVVSTPRKRSLRHARTARARSPAMSRRSCER